MPFPHRLAAAGAALAACLAAFVVLLWDTQVHNIGGMKRCCGNLGYQGPVEGTGWASGA